jgi:hypothetical protein
MKNVGWTLQEYKEGKPITMAAQRADPLADKIMQMPYYETQKDTVGKKMAKMDLDAAVAHISKDSSRQTVMKEIRVMCEPHLCVDQNIDDDIKEYCLPQFWQHKNEAASLLPPNACLGETRLQLEGEQVIIGIAHDAIEGKTIGQLRDAIAEFSPEQLASIVENKGFFIRMKPKTFIAIPPKFLLIQMVTQTREKAPEEGKSKIRAAAHGLRWGVVGDVEQVKASMFMQAGWCEYFDGQQEMATLSEKLEKHKNHLEVD